METFIDPETLNDIFLYVSAFFGAFIAALWLSLNFWAYRDIRSRTRDRMIHILVILLVAFLNIPGILIYLILRPKNTMEEVYEKTLEDEALLSEIESKKVCPGCGSAIRNQWQVCPYCFTRIHKTCSQCGQLLELPWQICPYCATPVEGIPQPIIEPEKGLPVEEPISAENLSQLDNPVTKDTNET